MPTLLPLWRAARTTGKQCGLTATGDYQPSLRSPWLAADEYVVREGEPANELYAVYSGSLMITKENSGSKMDSVYVGNIKEHELFGESAVFEGGLRTANVVTCGKTMLLEIERQEFQKFLSDYPAKTQAILLYLVNQLVGKLSSSNHELVLVRNQLYAIQDQRRGRSEFCVSLIG
ncbi:MAG: cyclic nucleotide-binding domain-containing protein [Candidatus Sedimenticola sp. (ex Thyasira tokunagai)]